MKVLKFSSTGPDALYLTKADIFFGVLFTLAIFRNGWPEGKLGSQMTLQQALDWFREMFHGGLTGNRLHIASRKTARQDLDLRIEKILSYVVVMGEESDITMLLNSGVVTEKTGKRARRNTKPAVINP